MKNIVFKIIFLMTFLILPSFDLFAFICSNSESLKREKILVETDKLKIYHKENAIFMEKDNKTYEILKSCLYNHNTYGLSPDDNFYAYSLSEDLDLYIYDIKNNENILVIPRNIKMSISYNISRFLWQENSSNFLVGISNDTMGNVKYCYYENLKQKHCFTKLNSVSEYPGDILFDKDFEDINLNAKGEVIFKSKDSDVFWKTNVKGESPQIISKKEAPPLFRSSPFSPPL